MTTTERYPFRLFSTQFHGGGLLSRHATEAAAETARKRAKIGDCTCGCAVVVGPTQAEPAPAHEGQVPYRAAS